MRCRYTFFASKADRRSLKKFFDKKRKSYYPFEEALKAIAEEALAPPHNVKVFTFLKNYYIGLTWNEFQSTPTDVTNWMLRDVSDSYDKKAPVNAIEVGLIGGVNKFFGNK